MKKLLLILILLVNFTANAQELAVKSFKKLPNDLTAKVLAPRQDQNGVTAAVVKIVTTETGFTFDGGMMGIVGSQQKTAEIWLYLPEKIQRITISHPELGQIRNYTFPEKIERACTYELVLISGRVTTIVEEDAGVQYFVLNYTPADEAIDLYIDDNNYIKGENGTVTQSLPYGEHTYRIESQKYKPVAGVIEIGREKTELDIEMESNCGTIEFISEPENGAEVSIDGRYIGTTPFVSEELVKGEYEIEVKSDYYLPLRKTVSVVDLQQLTDTLHLTANYANVTVDSDNDASVYVNEMYKGEAGKSFRLTPGYYTFEVRKDAHRTQKLTTQIVAGEDRTVSITAPTPIYGSAEIVAKETGAAIYIDGKEYGTTPNVINNLLIGSHEVKIVSDNKEYNGKITIEEGKTEKLTATLISAAAFGSELDENFDSKNFEEYEKDIDNYFPRDKDGNPTTKKPLDVFMSVGLDLEFAEVPIGYTIPLLFSLGGIENKLNLNFGLQYRINTVSDAESNYVDTPYLESSQLGIPVYLRYNMGKNSSRTKFYIAAGASFNFNFGGSYKWWDSDEDRIISYPTQDGAITQPMNTSLIGKIGLTMGGNKKGFLDLALIYRYDVSPVYDINKIDYTDPKGNNLYELSYAVRTILDTPSYVGLSICYNFKL